jgi:hypothetical protein
MPAHKKAPSARARANRASTAATLTDGRTIIRPTLPPRFVTDEDGYRTEVEWQPATVEWWNDLWASPMAAEYHSSDRHALFILAALVDQFWTNPDQKLAAEIRLQRIPFGLTPYDRRRLEWTIENVAEAQDRGAARRSRQGSRQPDPKSDPRLALVANS